MLYIAIDVFSCIDATVAVDGMFYVFIKGFVENV